MICTNMYNIYDVDQLLIIDVVTLLVVLYLKLFKFQVQAGARARSICLSKATAGSNGSNIKLMPPLSQRQQSLE